jgi:hypothetical protein
MWSVVAEWLGRRTLNQRVVGSNPQLGVAIISRNACGIPNLIKKKRKKKDYVASASPTKNPPLKINTHFIFEHHYLTVCPPCLPPNKGDRLFYVFNAEGLILHKLATFCEEAFDLRQKNYPKED